MLRPTVRTGGIAAAIVVIMMAVAAETISLTVGGLLTAALVVFVFVFGLGLVEGQQGGKVHLREPSDRDPYRRD